ncbi:MAG: PQQ-binding-like beta-propeller repeat protein, partial [Bacteroidales bacterium]|nr:PQQ-binding-like beta-propeller repeat protein [Bacteroidales bacterium]
EYQEIKRKIDSVRREQGRVSNLSRRSIYRAMLMGDASLKEQLEKLTHAMNKLSEEEEKLKTSSAEWFYSREDLKSIVLAGDQIVAGGEGIVVGLDSETGQELWRDDVEGVAHGLSVSDNRLLVSTDIGRIYCYADKPGANVDKTPAAEQTKTAAVTVNEKTGSEYEKAAEAILKETAVDNGYCLVLDCGDGQLAAELAKRSNLYVIGIEKDPRKAQKARGMLDKAGLYGTRAIVENWTIASLPEYFANLVVSGNISNPGATSYAADEIFRVMTPGRGIALFGQPGNANAPPAANLDKLADQWRSFEIEEPVVIQDEGSWILFSRAMLAGAGGWTHQYG